MQSELLLGASIAQLNVPLLMRSVMRCVYVLLITIQEWEEERPSEIPTTAWLRQESAPNITRRICVEMIRAGHCLTQAVVDRPGN